MIRQSAFTAFLNDHVGGVATQMLHAVHITPYDPQAPITNSFAMEILVFLLLVLFFLIVRFSLSVEQPAAPQQVAEWIHGFVSEQAGSIIGEGSEHYVMFVSAVVIFILSCNLIGLIPGFQSPTAWETVTLGMALLVFVYYHFQAIRVNGVLGHAKHFVGPIWWIAWMMIPIEIVSHFARILSLSVRLYANMFAGGMVYLVFFSLVPFAFPVLFLGLHLGVALIQAYIFMLLTMIYLAEGTAHSH